MKTSRWVRGGVPFVAAALVVGVVVGAAATRRVSSHLASPPSVPPTSPTPTSTPIRTPTPTSTVSLLPSTPAVAGTIDATAVSATLVPVAPPTSTMIGGANDLLADGTAVLAATNAGIARSTDNGDSWRSVLTGITAWSLSRAGSGFAAVGLTTTAAGVRVPVFVTSADGVQWHVNRSEISAVANDLFPEGKLAATGLGDHAVDVLAADDLMTAAGSPALRSIDGGRTWSQLSIEANSIAVTPDGHTMYATAPSHTSACVYRSVDAGARWSVLASSCQAQPLSAIEFVDSQHGFAAGGTPTKYGGSQFLEATADGGKTWQVRWSTPYVADGSGRGDDASGVMRLSFADADHGYALTGGCTGGGNGPCGGAVYSTTDGGAHWTPTGQYGIAVVALDDNLAMIGLWIPAGLALTRDGGKDWTTRTNAQSLSGQHDIAGTGKFLLWRNDLGTFLSDDGGTTWKPATGLDSLQPDAQPLLAAPPHDVLAVSSDQSTMWSSTDGHSSRTAPLPGATTSAPLGSGLAPGGQLALVVGMSDDCPTPMLASKMALVKPDWTPQTSAAMLYLSDDAGDHWRPAARLPFLVTFNGSFAFDGELMSVVDACGNLEISTDRGRSWSAVELTKEDEACSASLYAREIWLSCLDSAGSGEIHVLHSPNAGGSWTRLAVPGSDENWLPVDAFGPDSAVAADGGALWRTTDGGLNWAESWPTLAGE